MDRVKASVLAAVSMLLVARPAFANSMPGPAAVNGVALMFIAIFALTAIGGGYAVLKVKYSGKRRLGWKIAGAFFVSVLSGTSLGAMFWILAILTGLGIARGISLIAWGAHARFAKKKPEYVAAANPWRLMASGCVLILVILAIPGSVMNMIVEPLQRRGTAIALNAGAKKAYEALESYAGRHPKAAGPVTCDDLKSEGLELHADMACSSDMNVRSGKPVSGNITIRWTKRGIFTPTLSKPEAVISYKGDLTEAVK